MLKEFAEPGKTVKSIEKKIVYFDQISGLDIENMTRLTCELALERALELGIRYIVLACSKGTTGRIICKVAKEKGIKIGEEIFMVSVGAGKKAPWAKETMKHGMINISGTRAFSGIERSLRWKYGGISPMEIISATLKRICQGLKVCVEIAVMAADQGEIPLNEDIVSMAGTHRGSDTAVVMRSNLSSNFFHEDEGIKIREIICMPYVRSPPGFRRKYGAHGV